VQGLDVSSRYVVPSFKRLPTIGSMHPLPGFGESEKPRRHLNVARLSDSLAAWMRKIGLERTGLVGNSFRC